MRYLLSTIAIFACGNDGVHRLVDSGIDAPRALDGAPAGPVSLTITAGSAVAGITVHFQDADGAVVATTTTDATGTAAATMASGGTVTAVEPFTPGELFTFAGVEIGDDLHLDRPPAPPSITVSIVAPVDPAPGTAHTLLYTTCGAQELSDPGPTSVTLTGCGATIDAVVESYDASFTPLHALVQAGVAVSDGATVTLTGDYQPLVTSTFALTNLPNELGGVGVEQGFATTRGIVVEPFENDASIGVVSGAGSSSLQVPAIAGAVAIEDVELGGELFGQRGVVSWGPYQPAFALDGSALVGPYASMPTWDTTTNAVTYTLGAGVTPDVDLVQIDFERTTPSLEWTWHLVAPHGTSLPLPHIPAGATDFNPIPTDGADIAELTVAKVPGGYDAVRATLLDTDIGDGLVTATAGAVSFEQLPPVCFRARPATLSQVWRQGAHRIGDARRLNVARGL